MIFGEFSKCKFGGNLCWVGVFNGVFNLNFLCSALSVYNDFKRSVLSDHSMSDLTPLNFCLWGGFKTEGLS